MFSITEEPYSSGEAKSFQLLRAPHLVLSNIYEYLDPGDVVSIALCSRRSFEFMKFTCRRNHFSNWKCIFTTTTQGYEVLLETNDDTQGLIQKKVVGMVDIEWLREVLKHSRTSEREIEGIKFTVMLDSMGCVYTIWEDVNLGKKLIVDFIRSVLKLEINECRIDGGSIWLVDYLNKRQVRKVDTVVHGYTSNTSTFHKKYISEEDLSSLLTLSDIKNLEVHSTAPRNFAFNEEFSQRDTIHLQDGLWVTKGCLMRMDSKEISISNMNPLCLKDIKQLLLSWYNEFAPRLKVLSIQGSAHPGMPIFDVLFAGFSDSVTWDNGQREYYGTSGIRYLLFGKYNIRRPDGIVASFALTTSGFQLVVWPDAKNNNPF